MLKTKFQAVLDFGMVPPPLSIHKYDRDLFAASWACLRETLVVGRVPRYFKEAVASGASEANQCPYCVGAHSMMFDVYEPAKNKQPLVDAPFRSWDLEKLKMWARSSYLPENDQAPPPFPKTFQSEIVGPSEKCSCQYQYNHEYQPTNQPIFDSNGRTLNFLMSFLRRNT